MTEPPLDRLDALELAVTQIADAVERMAEVVATTWTKKHLKLVREQLQAARRLLGTER